MGDAPCDLGFASLVVAIVVIAIVMVIAIVILSPGIPLKNEKA